MQVLTWLLTGLSLVGVILNTGTSKKPLMSAGNYESRNILHEG